MTTYSYRIDPEFRDRLGGVPKEADEELERQLKATNGPIHALILWKGTNIIIDGMRRYAVCQRFKLPLGPSPIEMEFGDREEVMHWMDSFQACRRNETEHQAAIRRSRMVAYERQKNGAGAIQTVADQEGVSARTVMRDMRYVEQLDTLHDDLKKRISDGDLKVSRKVVENLAALSPTHQLAVVAQYERGDYGSLHQALHGEGDPEPEEEAEPAEEADAPESDNVSPRKAAKPRMAKDAKEALAQADKLLGKFRNTVAWLNEIHPDEVRLAACQKLITNLGNVFEGWKKDLS